MPDLVLDDPAGVGAAAGQGGHPGAAGAAVLGGVGQRDEVLRALAAAGVPGRRVLVGAEQPGGALAPEVHAERGGGAAAAALGLGDAGDRGDHLDPPYVEEPLVAAERLDLHQRPPGPVGLFAEHVLFRGGVTVAEQDEGDPVGRVAGPPYVDGRRVPGGAQIGVLHRGVRRDRAVGRGAGPDHPER